jgi:DNA-binding transcriptional LysR family regulator
MPEEMPDLATLELLVGIDDCGRLGAASRAIRQLERRFRMALVERSPRGSTLTAPCTVIVHWAHQVLADVQAATRPGSGAARGA